MARRGSDGPSFGRLDAFARGMIWGLYMAGTTRKEIRTQVGKQDGRPVNKRTIDAVIAHKKRAPVWRGADVARAGRPQSLTDDQKQQLVKLVFAERGSAKVTVKYCQKRLPFLRRVSRKTVERAL